MPRFRPPTSPVARLVTRLGAQGLVLALAGFVVLGVLVAAAVDLYRLSAERGPVERKDARLAPAQSNEPGDQFSVRVVVSANGPFEVGVEWIDGKTVERSSSGRDVVITRVFTGSGPYASVGAQLTGSGAVRCRVDVDGERVDGRKAEGLYAVAVCAG